MTHWHIYKPSMGQKYVSNIPYNEFITPTTFILPIINILKGFPIPILTLGILWTRSMPSRYVNTATRLAEASWRCANDSGALPMTLWQKCFNIVNCYARYGDLIKQYEVPLSRMLHDILDGDHLQWHPPLIRHYTNFGPITDLDLVTELDFLPNCERFP